MSPASVPAPDHGRAAASDTRRLLVAMLVAGVVAVLVAAVGAGVRSTHGGQAAVDEPQYLLTALSLWEDRSLDISDELAAQRWRDFHDAELPVQTEAQADGRQLSPHDPLLPLLLAAPMGLGGWLAAKLAMALLAGACAALLVWVCVRRFALPPWLAAAGAAAAFASPPLAVYGQQVYPELPAAAATLVAVAGLTGPVRARSVALVGLAVVALPWLSVKYAPVAAVLALLGLARLWRAGRARSAGLLAGGLGVAGAGYLVVHQVVWGGWTVYASGDHFVETGEFSVVGVTPDYLGRSTRLVGLLLDRDYGLVAWQAAWLLVVVAAVALVRRRPPGAAALLLPAATAWVVATWAAFTMHGFWWPGRQVVVVLPLLVVAVLWWLARVAGPRLRGVAAVVGASGVVTMAALLVDGWSREITWVSGFQHVDDPVSALLRPLLPDYRAGGVGTWLRHGAWLVALAVAGAAAWRHAARVEVANDPKPDPLPASRPTEAPLLTSR